MRKIAYVAAIAALAAPAAAQATKVELVVNAYADPAAANATTYVLVGGDGIAVDGLEFREYAAQIDKVLAGRGFTRATSADAAAIRITVSYSIGAPKEHHSTYRIPIYNGPNNPTTWLPVNNDSTSFDRQLKLSASRSEGGTSAREVWRVDVASTGGNGDLREIFPYLLMAAAPVIGTSTGKAVPVKIKVDGKEITAFRASNGL